MLNPLTIIFASMVITAIYYLIDFDINFWICVAVYAFAHSFVAIFVASFFLSPGIGIVLYAIANFLTYIPIGIGVVYALQSVKDTDPKTAIALGVIAQVMIDFFVSSLMGKIIDLL